MGDPIMGMNRAIGKIGEGALDTRISPQMRIEELGELANGINNMARLLELDRSTLQQRINEATQALQKKKDEAEKASQDKTRFLASASHDLRQPMHALGLFIGELRAKITAPEQLKMVSKIEESVDALSGLLDALLDISKLDAGVVIPQFQEVDLSALLSHIAKDFASIAALKSIKLRVVPSLFKVRSDPVLLDRILINLISNAVRYTPRGGAVLIGCRRRGGMIRIEVRDNGKGIPLEEQENIFLEFVQLSNPERDRGKGLGLGLAIVKRLALLLNHPVSLRSAEHQGSVFSIEVPWISASSEHQTPPLGSTMEDGSLLNIENLELSKVLVVDDDILVRTSTQGILETWGARVFVAGSFSEAIKISHGEHIDLIICDYRLPDGNGLKLAEYFKQSYPLSLPFILISGDTSPEVLHAANSYGLHLLHKPVRPAKLRSLVLYLLEPK